MESEVEMTLIGRQNGRDELGEPNFGLVDPDCNHAARLVSLAIN